MVARDFGGAGMLPLHDPVVGIKHFSLSGQLALFPFLALIRTRTTTTAADIHHRLCAFLSL